MTIPFVSIVAAMQGRWVYGVGFCVEDIASNIQDALSRRCLHYRSTVAGVVDEVVGVKQQKEVFSCFRQEE